MKSAKGAVFTCLRALISASVACALVWLCAVEVLPGIGASLIMVASSAGEVSALSLVFVAGVPYAFVALACLIGVCVVCRGVWRACANIGAHNADTSDKES